MNSIEVKATDLDLKKVPNDLQPLLHDIELEHNALENSLAGKLIVNPDLIRRLVSFQGNCINAPATLL